MLSFLVRRLLASVLIIFAATFLVYNLVAISGNPLGDLIGSSSPNKGQLIAARVQSHHLDVAPPLRYFIWLGGAAGCLVGHCDLGSSFQNQPVATVLPVNMQATLQLVTFATILSLVIGIAIGMMTALRQYSFFDTAFTFASFFLYSLPSFLMAVVLKLYVALPYNDFLQDPRIPLLTYIFASVLLAVITLIVVGGSWKKRLLAAAAVGVGTAVMLVIMQTTNWFLKPALGPVFILIFMALVGFAAVSIFAGVKNRRAMIVAGANVLIAYICYWALQGLLDVSSFGTLIILGVATLVVSLLIGWFLGEHDKGMMMRLSAVTGLGSAALILIDRTMRSWPEFMSNTNYRPIATIGSQTPGLNGDVWISALDGFAHLLLPTISLMLISVASYSRYARSGMLEVLGQDYIRTARAKGVSERDVIVVHAFRNMLIPIATLIATDVGALLGGAVITETVFGISGMGQYFASNLGAVDLDPVMGYIIVIAITAIVANIIADLAYALLDPRVRVS